ncbi:PLDc N-terminal domain-containing protein [Niastella vici]
MPLLISMPGGLEWLIILGVIFIVFILPIWALIDIIRSQFQEPNNKIIWVLVVLLLPFLGSILYLAIGRGQKRSIS